MQPKHVKRNLSVHPTHEEHPLRNEIQLNKLLACTKEEKEPKSFLVAWN